MVLPELNRIEISYPLHGLEGQETAHSIDKLFLLEASGFVISGTVLKVGLITKLYSYNLIEQTIPDNPNHPGQKFRITGRGIIFLRLIESRIN